jgi:hypothetical protein
MFQNGGQKMVANDIVWEGLIMLIMITHLWECVMNFIFNIVIHELE